MAVATHGHNDPNGFAINANEECPFPGFDTGNGVLLRKVPPLPSMNATDVGDAFMRIGTIGFIDALDLDLFGHGNYAPCWSGAESGGGFPQINRAGLLAVDWRGSRLADALARTDASAVFGVLTPGRTYQLRDLRRYVPRLGAYSSENGLNHSLSNSASTP